MSEENRHGMDEFNTRLSAVEAEVRHTKESVTTIKQEFRDHDQQEKEDRKEILRELKRNRESIECIKRSLSEMEGFKKGVKAGAAMLLMFFGGIFTLGLKKLLGL